MQIQLGMQCTCQGETQRSEEGKVGGITEAFEEEGKKVLMPQFTEVAADPEG